MLSQKLAAQQERRDGHHDRQEQAARGIRLFERALALELIA